MVFFTRRKYDIGNNNNKTKKTYGGDICKNKIFKKILSIGYELETSSLAKFSLLSSSSDDEQILLNTSSNSNDYGIIKKINVDDFTEEEYDKYANRLDELFEIDAYTSESINKNKINKLVKLKNSTFIIANDIAATPFTKYLNKLCDFGDSGDDDNLIDKNELYIFKSDDGNNYKINFDTWDKQDCGTIADVEWVMTYYNPEINKNIILNTFMNVVKNLILHLNSLEKTNGKLIIKFDEKDKETIKKPVNRILYNLPDTNLYYLQTHHINEELDIDDICFVPQMTFSCHAKDVVDIFKELTKDSIQNFEDYTRLANDRMDIIERIENCIDMLLKNYNKSVTKEYKIIESRNKVLVKSIKNYIFMILFKLERYFDNYLLDEKVIQKLKTAKYLKDTLFYNSRHTNYELYKSLKKTISLYFSNSISDKEIISIVQKIIIQQPILEEYWLDDKNNVRKNALLISNTLDKNNKQYGNPYYSLASYFDFFENPIDNESPDWLVHKSIDIFSNTTDINNNIVLVEVRSFARMFATYMYSVADADLKKNMTTGICNRLLNKLKPDINGFSIGNMKRFIELYNKK